MVYSLLAFGIGVLAYLAFTLLSWPRDKETTFLNSYPFESKMPKWLLVLCLALGMIFFGLVLLPAYFEYAASSFLFIPMAFVFLSGLCYLLSYFFGFDNPVWHLRLSALAFVCLSVNFVGQGFYLFSIGQLYGGVTVGKVLGVLAFILGLLSLWPLLDRRIANPFQNEIEIDAEGNKIGKRPRFVALAFYERLYPFMVILTGVLGLLYIGGMA